MSRHQLKVVVNTPNKYSDGTSSTKEISVDEKLDHIITQNDLIAEQLKKWEASQHIKRYETTTTTVKVPLKLAGPVVGSELKVARLSGPIQFFLKLLELWELNSEDKCKLLGYELADIQHVDQVLSGQLPISRDLKDRITNLLVIRKRLSGLFRDTNTENEWLRERHVELGNKSPIELILSGSMENLLLIKEFVEHVSGL